MTRKIKKVRTLKDIRNDFRVESIENEGDDGYWCYLIDGYLFDGEVGIIHEYTVKDVCNSLNYRTERKTI